MPRPHLRDAAVQSMFQSSSSQHKAPRGWRNLTLDLHKAARHRWLSCDIEACYRCVLWLFSPTLTIGECLLVALGSSVAMLPPDIEQTR